MLITNDESWLDLRLGDDATVRGLLTYAGKNGFTMQFADWSMLAIDAVDASGLAIHLDEEIMIKATRTEDGLFATPEQVASVRLVVDAE